MARSIPLFFVFPSATRREYFGSGYLVLMSTRTSKGLLRWEIGMWCFMALKEMCERRDQLVWQNCMRVKFMKEPLFCSVPILSLCTDAWFSLALSSRSLASGHKHWLELPIVKNKFSADSGSEHWNSCWAGGETGSDYWQLQRWKSCGLTSFSQAWSYSGMCLWEKAVQELRSLILPLLRS